MSELEKLLKGVEVQWKTLGEVIELSNIGVDKKSFEDEKKVKLLNFVDVFKNQYITNETPTMVVTASDKKINDCGIKKGDVFITPSSEKIDEIGFSAMAIEDFDNAVYSYHIMRLRVVDKGFLYPAYLNFLFSSSHVRKQIRLKSQGITRYGLTQPNWKNIQIQIPPLKIQKEIVRILDTFTELTTELTTELITELTARKKQYSYYRQNLIVNSSSRKELLGDISNIYLGLTYTPKYIDEGVKFISAKNTSKDFLDLEDVKYISKEEYNKSTSNAKPKRGDVLFTRVGSNLGHPVIVDTDEDLCMFVSLGYIRVNPKKVLNSYIKHWMNTDLFWSQVRRKAYGAAKINLNTGWLKKFEVILPSIEEQERIVTILDKFDTLTTSISEGLPKEIELRKKQYEYYREKLLMFPE